MGQDFARLESREFQKALNDLSKQINKVKGGADAYVKKVAPHAHKNVDKHFKDEMGPDKKWDDWSTSYAAFLKRIGRDGNQILVFDGSLRQKTVPAIGIKGRPGEIPILVNPAKTKSGFPYAFAHNEGGSQLPKREFMWVDDATMDKMARSTLEFVLQGK
jgi:hypothetical protein